MFDTDTFNAIVQVAKNNAIEPAKLLAVTQVESAGTPFWTVNGKKVPVIRFEGHYFYRLLNAEQRAIAVKQGLASSVAGAVKNPSSAAARYDLLARARKINASAADMSVSWGVGQVMGDHWKNLGYKSIAELVKLATDSVGGQVDLMLRFIKVNGLLDELQGKKWAAFAKGYNGSNYKKNKYDTQLATAYANFAKAKTPSAVAKVETTIVQQQLTDLGIYTDKIDGELGPKTQEAIETFQATNGLTVDGDPGQITTNKITEAVTEVKETNFQNALPGAGAVVTGAATLGGAVISNGNAIIDTIKSATESTNAASALFASIGASGVIVSVSLAIIAAFTIFTVLAKRK